MFLPTPEDMQRRTNPYKCSFMAQNIIINHNTIIDVEIFTVLFATLWQLAQYQVLTCKHIRAAAEMIGETSIQKVCKIVHIEIIKAYLYFLFLNIR